MTPDKPAAMPDVLYVNEPTEEHTGDLLYEARASRFHARHKYIRAQTEPEQPDAALGALKDLEYVKQFLGGIIVTHNYGQQPYDAVLRTLKYIEQGLVIKKGGENEDTK